MLEKTHGKETMKKHLLTAGVWILASVGWAAISTLFPPGSGPITVLIGLMIGMVVGLWTVTRY